jgi:hypothetical protein
MRKRQSVVALSTIEDEYMATTYASKETVGYVLYSLHTVQWEGGHKGVAWGRPRKVGLEGLP